MTTAPPPSTWRLLGYSLLAIPLGMAALPIYVHVPKFYADVMGLNLAAIGGLLLAARAFDAVQDPLLGLWSDRVRGWRWGFITGRMTMVVLAMPLLAIGMVGLFRPPRMATEMVGWWFIAMLLIVYVAFSLAQISYQAYGAEISDDPFQRTRVTTYREGLGLLGIFLASILPQVLSDAYGARAGFAQYSYLFLPLLLVAGLITLHASPPPRAFVPAAKSGAFAAMLKPFANKRFVSLLIVFVFNGIAAAIPATLVLFFVEDVLKRPDMGGIFLIAYFAAGGLGLPLWLALSARIGKGRAWLIGMLVSVVAFMWAFRLGAGDCIPFVIICIMSGLGLGADLALPPSLLADVIDDDEQKGLARNEGAYFGLWNLVTKLNLALAAGIALPALAMLGYQPGITTSSQALVYLAGIYALLPCVLKSVAALLLLASPFVRRQPGKER